MCALSGISMGTLSIMIFPILYAILSFKYLQSSGEAVRVHSMPVTRKQLFLAHVHSGLIAITAPYLVTAMVLAVLHFSLPAGMLTLFSILQWLGLSLFFSCIFFACTVFSGMIIGNSLLQGVFVYIMFLLPAGLYELIGFSLNTILKGFSANTSSLYLQLSPFTGYLMVVYRQGLNYLPLQFWCLSAAYFALFMVGAYALYLKRNLENVGQTIQFPILNPILKSLGVFCTMLLFGAFFKEITNCNAGILIGYFVGGIVGYVVLEMSIQKNLQCKLSLKEIGVLMGVFFIGVAVVAFDLPQYGAKTMPLDEIESVSFYSYDTNMNYSSINSNFSDPETIQAIENLYTKSVKNMPTLFILRPERNTQDLSFKFVNKNGKSFSRNLSVEKDLITADLTAVIKTKSYLESEIDILTVDAQEVESLRIATPLGQIVLADPSEIQALLKTAQSETYALADVSTQNTSVPMVSFYATISNKAKSYPYRSESSTVLEKRVEMSLYMTPLYKKTFEMINHMQKPSKLMVTPNQISKVLIKPLLAYPADDNSVLYSTESLSAIDPTVTCINDPKQIQALLSSPLKQQAKSVDDYLVNFVLDSDNSVTINGYIINTDFPAVTIH